MDTPGQVYGGEDRAYINDPKFWKVIEERRWEPGIPWEVAKKFLGLDDQTTNEILSLCFEDVSR